ncbi:MAG: TetR/AcrR family transcriptional regulator [Catenulispora sp.]|nr:TetR/AcrR family transcriptional regulator [Catenulispora sp.]
MSRYARASSRARQCPSTTPRTAPGSRSRSSWPTRCCRSHPPCCSRSCWPGCCTSRSTASRATPCAPRKASSVADHSTGTLTERQRQIAVAARGLLDAEGPDGLTMRRVADVLGIKAPSLYKHVPDKTALELLVIADGFTEIAEALERATTDTADPLPALAKAYRDYAVAHPHLYRLMNYRPLRRDMLPEGLDERAAMPLLKAVGRNSDRARALWAFAHGMVSLEIDGRFPPGADLPAAWEAGLATFA